MEWKLATESKPKRYERVLLKIRHEDFPVVGFWGERKWDICTVNILGSGLDGNFYQSQVTHYAHITDMPVG